jgi:hypothetical protein
MMDTKDQRTVRKDMGVNEHERLSIITPISQINVKDQRTVRKDMGVNEHERLSIITPIS